MKKFVILLAAATLALSFSGCGDDDPLKNIDPNNPISEDAMEEIGEQIKEQMEKNEEENEKQAQEFKENQKEISGASIAVENAYSLNFKTYAITEWMSQKAITFTADFTNNSDHDISLLSAIGYMDFYQDGASITNSYSEFDKDGGTSIKPGKTLEVTFSYSIRDESTDIEVEAKDFSYEPAASCTIKLK